MGKESDRNKTQEHTLLLTKMIHVCLQAYTWAMERMCSRPLWYSRSPPPAAHSWYSECLLLSRNSRNWHTGWPCLQQQSKHFIPPLWKHCHLPAMFHLFQPVSSSIIRELPKDLYFSWLLTYRANAYWGHLKGIWNQDNTAKFSVIEDLLSCSCSHPNLPNNKSGTYGSLTLSSGTYLRALWKRDQFIYALSIPGIRMVPNKCAINIWEWKILCVDPFRQSGGTEVPLNLQEPSDRFSSPALDTPPPLFLTLSQLRIPKRLKSRSRTGRFKCLIKNA